MHALLLGAGYSRWAAGLPVASGLFDFEIEPFGVREEGRLARVAALKGEWNAANPEGEAEQFIADALMMKTRSRKDVLWYIVRRLSEPFIWMEYHAGRYRRQVFMIDENRCPRPGAEFLSSIVGGCSGIITTNYDMLVEYSLTTRGFNYGMPGEQLRGRGPYPLAEWLHPITLTGLVPLAKIHGSVSWDEVAKYTDGRRGLTGNALIVAPTPDKGPPAELADVWDLAKRTLQRAQKVLVFGFSFHPYDRDVLQLLAKAGHHLRSVLLVDICPQLQRAHNVWPEARIDHTGPPPQGLDDIKAWLRS